MLKEKVVKKAEGKLNSIKYESEEKAKQRCSASIIMKLWKAKAEMRIISIEMVTTYLPQNPKVGIEVVQRQLWDKMGSHCKRSQKEHFYLLIYWRIIAFQSCVGFCHTTMHISHVCVCTCVCMYVSPHFCSSLQPQTSKSPQRTGLDSLLLLSCVQLFATLWTVARQASLSFVVSRSLLRLMSIESVTPSNHLIFCHTLLQPSVFPSIKVFSNESALLIRCPKH